MPHLTGSIFLTYRRMPWNERRSAAMLRGMPCLLQQTAANLLSAFQRERPFMTMPGFQPCTLTTLCPVSLPPPPGQASHCPIMGHKGHIVDRDSPASTCELYANDEVGYEGQEWVLLLRMLVRRRSGKALRCRAAFRLEWHCLQRLCDTLSPL